MLPILKKNNIPSLPSHSTDFNQDLVKWITQVHLITLKGAAVRAAGPAGAGVSGRIRGLSSVCVSRKYWDRAGL